MPSALANSASKAIGALDIPGGKDELIEQRHFDNISGAKLIDVGIAERFELAMVVFVEQDGVFGEEAVFCGVGLIGFDLRCG